VKVRYTHKNFSALLTKLAQMETALKIIRTWATFEHGIMLIPNQVAALCYQALEMVPVKRKAKAKAK
jgi:hypothetical protein